MRESNLRSDLAALQIDRAADVRKPRHRVAYSFVAVVACVIGAMFLLRSRNARPEGTTAVPAAVSRPARQSAATVLTASGYVVARREAVVSAKIQGRLASLSVDEGSSVRQGQIIARLDDADLRAQTGVARAQVQGAAAALSEQQRQLRLARALENSGAVSGDQLEAAMSRVRIAEASLSQNKASLALSKANLENTVIRAPFDGVIVKKMAEVGESVAPIPPGVNLSTSSGAIVAIADLSSLEAEADVSETNVGKLRGDQPAQVTVDALPDRTFAAVVREVTPTADRTKATVTVKVTILDKDPALRPEMSAKVTFLERKESHGRIE